MIEPRHTSTRLRGVVGVPSYRVNEMANDHRYNKTLKNEIDLLETKTAEHKQPKLEIGFKLVKTKT